MASKTHYTDEFQKKVVGESKKGDLSLEELATKYDLPIALLKHWLKNVELNSFFFRLAENTNPKEPFFKRAKNYFKKPLSWIKKHGGRIIGCLSLLIIVSVLIKLRPGIIESEMQDIQQPVLIKMDSLMNTENAVKEKMESLQMMDSTLNAINDQLKMRITPLMKTLTNKPICNCKKDTVE